MRKALVASLVFHIAVLAILLVRLKNQSSGDYNFSSNSHKPLQVKTLTQEEFQKKLSSVLDKDKLQIVQSDDQLKSDQPADSKEKKFLSKNDQLVDKNTRAAKIGKFKNVLHEGATSDSAKNDKASEKSSTAKKSIDRSTEHAPVVAKDLFQLTPNVKDLEQKNALTAKTGRLRQPASLPPVGLGGRKGEGVSATDDYLQDVAVGANTLLNTKEYKFYSFYERVREKLAYQWHSRLDEEVQTIFSSGQNITSDQRTKVEIHLDKRGQILNLRVVQSSGFAALDRAATQAFYLAAPFPNPPTGMVGDDQQVALSWDFVVVAQEASGMKVEIQQSGF